jgi:hypothetical protein
VQPEEGLLEKSPKAIIAKSPERRVPAYTPPRESWTPIAHQRNSAACPAVRRSGRCSRCGFGPRRHRGPHPTDIG